MFEGDSLAVLSLLVSAMIGAAIGAIPTPPGPSRNTLWWIVGVFGLLAVGWLLIPVASPIVQGARALVSAVVQSGAFIMLGTISIVALMQARQKAGGQPSDLAEAAFTGNGGPKTKAAPRPSFAVRGNASSKWMPDWSLTQAANYLGAKSRWRQGRNWLGPDDISNELSLGLYSGKLTGWAKAHPTDDEWYQVSAIAWEAIDIHLDKNYVFFRNQGAAGYEVRLSKGELQAAYPAD